MKEKSMMFFLVSRIFLRFDRFYMAWKAVPEFRQDYLASSRTFLHARSSGSEFFLFSRGFDHELSKQRRLS